MTLRYHVEMFHAGQWVGIGGRDVPTTDKDFAIQVAMWEHKARNLNNWERYGPHIGGVQIRVEAREHIWNNAKDVSDKIMEREQLQKGLPMYCSDCDLNLLNIEQVHSHRKREHTVV